MHPLAILAAHDALTLAKQRSRALADDAFMTRSRGRVSTRRNSVRAEIRSVLRKALTPTPTTPVLGS